MRGEPFPVAAALDDDLVAGVGQAVEGAVTEDGVLEESQPLVHGPVAGHHEAGGPVAVEDQFIEIGGLLGGEAVQSQVVQDQQVRREKGPEGTLQGVVGPGLSHSLEKVVGMDESDGVPGPDG